MKILVRYCITFSLVVVVFARSPQDAVPQEQLKMPYLKGIVADFVTRSRVAGASVLIEETGAHLISDDKGEFQVEGLAPGSYTIRVVHPNHRPLLYKNFQIIHGVHSFFVMKSGKGSDQPVIYDGTPRGQFVIDEDAEMIERREPVYPESALKEKAEGAVLLWVGVNEDGEVSSAWPKEGSTRKDLIEASLDAVQYFKFKPAKVKGKPMGVMVTVPFNFKLADKSTEYPLKLSQGPLTSEEIASALNYLGVQMYRFSYEVPFKHKLRIHLDQYLDGKLKETRNTGSGAQDPGKNNVTFFKYLKDDSVQFTVNLSSPGNSKIITFNRISIKGFPSSSWMPFFDARLQSGTKTPYCVYVLSPGALKIARDEPLESIISKNKFVVVASVELRLD